MDTEQIFRYKKPNEIKLHKYGFVKKEGIYRKDIPVAKKQFVLSVSVDRNSLKGIRVTEADSGEEYTLINVDDAQGSFVGHMREECENVLSDIASKCFDTEILKAGQTKRLLSHVHDKYDIEPEFLWAKYPGYAVFRRKDNRKWFAVIMTVDRSRIGLSGCGNVEIIDMKAKPEIVSSLLEQKEYFSAYHMNKKHWFTACLDGSLADEELTALLEASHERAGGK